MYISEAARRSSSTIKTIRHYESIGLLPPARRQGKYRVYDQQDVELLIFIKCAKEMGFRLKELQEIFAGHHGAAMPWASAQKALDDKKHEIRLKIAGLTQQLADLQAFEMNLEQSRSACPLETL